MESTRTIHKHGMNTAYIQAQPYIDTDQSYIQTIELYIDTVNKVHFFLVLDPGAGRKGWLNSQVFRDCHKL